MLKKGGKTSKMMADVVDDMRNNENRIRHCFKRVIVASVIFMKM